MENSLLSKSILVMAMNIAGAGILFLFHLLLARELTLEGYGYFAILISWLNALVIFAKFGFDGSSLKFVSVYHNDETAETTRKQYVSTTYLLAFATTLIICIGWYLFGHRVLEDALLGNVLLFSMALITVYTFIDIQTAMLRGFGFILLSMALRRLLLPVLSILMLIYLIYFHDSVVHIDNIIPMLLLANCVVFSIQAFFVFKSNNGFISFKNFEIRKEWIGMSAPVFITTGVQALLKQLDIIMVGFYLGAQAAGIYAVCSRLTRFTRIGFSAANTVSAPLFANYFAKNNLSELQNAASTSIKATIIMSAPLILIFSFFGEFALGLFGTEYIAGYTILLILMSGELVNVLTGQNGSMLNMTGKHVLLAKIEVTFLCINIILLYFLINRFEILGAAIAVATTMIARNICVTLVAKKYRGVDPSVWTLLNPGRRTD